MHANRKVSSPSRYLGSNDGTECPSNLVFVDTESHVTRIGGITDRRWLSLKLWVAIRVRLENGVATRRCVAKGDDAESFYKWLFKVSDANRVTWVFAHNLAHDATQLNFWEKLDDGLFTIKPIRRKSHDGTDRKANSWVGRLCLESRPCYMVVRAGLNKYKFVDTCNYWPTSLHEIGEMHGIPKMDMPSFDAPDDDWYAYCLRDVEIIESAVIPMMTKWRKEQCGVFQMTAPSLAMHHFMHTCNVRTPDRKKVDIVCSPDCKAHEMERACYFGGRIQAFYRGEHCGDLYHLDCNSLYPYVMRMEHYPRRFVKYDDNVNLESLRHAMDAYGVVATVGIDSRDEPFPVRIDGRQYHCTGRFVATLCGAELLRALDTGSVSRCYTAQYYSIAPLFREWVDYWYARKLKASRFGDDDKGEYEFCKLMLNSLSGKWAQRGRYWVDVHDEIPLKRWGPYAVIDDETNQWVKCRGVAGITQKLVEDKEPRHAFPAISACITSNAREYMLQVIRSLPDKTCLYMATDSLLLTSDGYRHLLKQQMVSDTEIGKFKLVGRHGYAWIGGPNNYQLDDKKVVSGPVAKARPDKCGRLVTDQWDSLPSIISRGAVDQITITTVAVRETRSNNKGVIGDDGWWKPYRITDDTDFTDRPTTTGYDADRFPDIAAQLAAIEEY